MGLVGDQHIRLTRQEFLVDPCSVKVRYASGWIRLGRIRVQFRYFGIEG